MSQQMFMYRRNNSEAQVRGKQHSMGAGCISAIATKLRTRGTITSSKIRQSQKHVYDFTIDDLDKSLLCRQNEYMELNIWSFDMANTMYNINSINDSLVLIWLQTVQV